MFEIIGKILVAFSVVVIVTVIEDIVNAFIKVDMLKYFSRKQRLFYNINQKVTGLVIVVFAYLIFLVNFEF